MFPCPTNLSAGSYQARSRGSAASNTILTSTSCSFLFAFVILGPQPTFSQNAEIPVAPNDSLATTGAETNPPPTTSVMVTPKPRSHPAESEVSVMGMIPYGDYRLISATVRCNAWTVGVEYDHRFPRDFLKARFDYATEIIPVVLLSQPV